MLQNATLRKSPPWSPNTCLLYRACHAKSIFPDPLQVPHACHPFWNCYKTLMFCSLLTRCTNLVLATQNDIWTSKSAPYPSVFCLLTSKCASRHNGVHFFNISTSKSALHVVCFVHFDLEMCFAPQWRALFQHLNFQKWSARGVFCTFWLGNLLCATTACTFSTSQLPKVLCTRQFLALLTSKCASRLNGVHFWTSQLPKVLCTWCVLYILTWKCASRHDSVQLVISHVARWPRTRRFSEPTFGPSRATNHWKNTLFRSFPTFSRAWIFFLLRLSLSWSSSSSSSSLLFSDSSHLCFSFVHVGGSLTSKLPSVPVVPHKAVAEVSKIGNLYESLVVVNQGWQSKATDGLKGDLISLSLSTYSTYLPS